MSSIAEGADFVRELEAKNQRLEASNRELLKLLKCPEGSVPVSRESLRNIALLTSDADVTEAIDEILATEAQA